MYEDSSWGSKSAKSTPFGAASAFSGKSARLGHLNNMKLNLQNLCSLYCRYKRAYTCTQTPLSHSPNNPQSPREEASSRLSGPQAEEACTRLLGKPRLPLILGYPNPRCEEVNPGLLRLSTFLQSTLPPIIPVQSSLTADFPVLKWNST